MRNNLCRTAMQNILFCIFHIFGMKLHRFLGKTLASCSSVDKNELNQFGRPAALIQ